MRSRFAPPLLSDMPVPAPSGEETTLERFAAAAAAGHTIALVVAKDPQAAAVYYFRDAMRAFTTYERLARLNSRPLVATISPHGHVLGSAQLDEGSVLGCCAPAWFAAALRSEAPGPAATTVALEPTPPAGPPARLAAS